MDFIIEGLVVCNLFIVYLKNLIINLNIFLVNIYKKLIFYYVDFILEVKDFFNKFKSNWKL